MIRSLVLGAAVLGGGGYYVSTNYMSADVVRTVNATPHDTWKGFDVLFRDYSGGLAELGTGEEPGGWGKPPSKVKSSYTSTDSKEVDFRVTKEGAEAIRIHVRFEPLDGGRKTRMLLDTDVSNLVLPDGARPGLVSSVMFRTAVGKLADELVKQIESGKLVRMSEAFAEMRRQAAADPRAGEYKLRAEEYRRREAQAAASKPMVDPDRAKLDPRGANPNPVY